MNQFLIESIVLSVLAGIIGVSLGALVIYFLSPFGIVFSSLAAIGGFSFSVFVGIVFGYYPALKASSLDPVDSLRGE